MNMLLWEFIFLRLCDLSLVQIEHTQKHRSCVVAIWYPVYAQFNNITRLRVRALSNNIQVHV